MAFGKALNHAPAKAEGRCFYEKSKFSMEGVIFACLRFCLKGILGSPLPDNSQLPLLTSTMNNNFKNKQFKPLNLNYKDL